jgi:hypothetical protein
MLHKILYLFEYPRILLIAAFVCVPAMFPLARFFFNDLTTFKRDVGLDSSVGKFAWLIGNPLEEYTLGFRIFAFAGCYTLVVLAAYQLIEKLCVLFNIVGA